MEMVRSQQICSICHPEYDKFDFVASTQCSSAAALSTSQDTIVYPSDGGVEFPDDNEAGDAENIFANAIPWRDVPQKV